MAGAAPPLSDADLVLFRGRGLLARAIQVAGRSPYSHVGMVALWRGVPMVLEATAAGVVAVTLAERVRQYGDRIDWFALRSSRWPEFSRDGAVSWMIRMAGRRGVPGPADALSRMWCVGGDHPLPRVSRPAGGDGGSVARKKSWRILPNTVWRCAGF